MREGSIRLIVTYSLGVLIVVLAYRKHSSIERRAQNIDLVKKYAIQLVKENNVHKNHFFTNHFLDDFEKQVSCDSVAVNMLAQFKSDSSYPRNVFTYLMKHLNNKPARQFSVPIEKDSFIINTVTVFSSHKFYFELQFIKQNNSLIMDGVSNISEYFHYLKCLKEQGTKHSNEIN